MRIQVRIYANIIRAD